MYFIIIIMILCLIFHFYKFFLFFVYLLIFTTTLQFYMDCELILGAQIDKVKNVFYMDLHGLHEI